MNAQVKMEDILKQLDKSKPKKLLLHACCAPCSSYVLEKLSNYFEITIFYYNPNIAPKEEYQKRVDEIKNFYPKLKVKYPISFIEGNYDYENWDLKTNKYKDLEERSIRCYECYSMRMEETARVAKEKQFDYFTTTLSISPYKNSDWLNQIGEELEKKYQMPYLYADFKKKNGYKRSIELSREYHLYRQNYCGCIYSKKAAEKREAKMEV